MNVEKVIGKGEIVQLYPSMHSICRRLLLGLKGNFTDMKTGTLPPAHLCVKKRWKSMPLTTSKHRKHPDQNTTIIIGLNAWVSIQQSTWRWLILSHGINEVLHNRHKCCHNWFLYRRKDRVQGWIKGKLAIKWNYTSMDCNSVGIYKDLLSPIKIGNLHTKIENHPSEGFMSRTC